MSFASSTPPDTPTSYYTVRQSVLTIFHYRTRTQRVRPGFSSCPGSPSCPHSRSRSRSRCRAVCRYVTLVGLKFQGCMLKFLGIITRADGSTCYIPPGSTARQVRASLMHLLWELILLYVLHMKAAPFQYDHSQVDSDGSIDPRKASLTFIVPRYYVRSTSSSKSGSSTEMGSRLTLLDLRCTSHPSQSSTSTCILHFGTPIQLVPCLSPRQDRPSVITLSGRSPPGEAWTMRVFISTANIPLILWRPRYHWLLSSSLSGGD